MKIWMNYFFLNDNFDRFIRIVIFCGIFCFIYHLSNYLLLMEYNTIEWDYGYWVDYVI
jgi:hypothetical protein